MAYSAADARQQILDRTAEAAEHLGVALAALGAAYETLDEAMADRLENELFRPVQLAFGRAQRTHEGFAARTSMAARTFAQPAPGHRDARAQIDRAVAEVRAAEDTLADLQDSMLPVEVGDPELRARGRGRPRAPRRRGSERARAHARARALGPTTAQGRVERHRARAGSRRRSTSAGGA
jgi:hypothetical protein